MPIIESADGSHTIFSDKFGVTYHSRHGAVTESQHVFINAGLRFKAAENQEVAVLEAGFGTGLNAFLTWLFAEKRGLRVRYTGLEIFPLSPGEAALLNYPDLLDLPDRRDDFFTLHTCAWEQPLDLSENFTFEKRKTPIEFVAFDGAFDLIYFDAFAPQAQPELWSENTLHRMHRALRPDGMLLTYCAQGEFRRTLKRVGFAVEKLQGPPGKREMTRATRAS